MPSKLANPDAAPAPGNGCNAQYNNGKKRLTRRSAHSTRARGDDAAETARHGESAAVGTRRATKHKVLSPTATGATTAQSRTKIVRNNRGRRSTALRLREVENIIAAAVNTAQKHRGLNRHTTIHFEAASISDPVQAIGRYLKLAGDWLRTQSAPFAYVWVRESGERKGEHVHILMHVPASLVGQFARRECGWRKRIGAKRSRGAFHTTPIGRSYRHVEVGIQFGEPYSNALAGIVSYIVKGAEPRAIEAFRLERVEPGGEIWGKRSGTSENIGRAARTSAKSLK